MPKKEKQEHITFSVKPLDGGTEVLVLIPNQFWGIIGISDAVKESVDLVFFDEQHEEAH